ncbi:serine/threonine protein kinase [Sphaerospermopsis torques-reginae]|uniref:Serine/threonine protein kinase n=1 Tax=Sphaerospermopsis torques-reginae ITEP-024 TaxID=984208 RepID=A0ABX8WWW8_9CYAN|nr:serine/threonine-protein kinase [Sphaerospermopsis torques-reginae]QYX30919.1 serine/threonine protein kinase [Sphaerospermopsis torques-reginae ITEP-024]
MNREILGDRYEVQQQLGKKSARRTFLARDTINNNLVIVKLLAFNSDFEWDDLKLFEREAETLQSLSHPSIPRYLDYFEVKESNYQGFALVQTYIPAKTLKQYLQTGRKFAENEVQEIAKAVLEILVYFHELHPPVIHRDIKPSNILLGERSGNSVGKVYLVDFGSVQTVLASETGTRTIVGSYGYMPQEQFGGRTVPASDLYSLGATLIYLITGTQPADLPQKNFRIQFEQVANLSPGLTNWLKKMIEPDLAKRFTSAKTALQALETPEKTDITNSTIAKPAGSQIRLIEDEEYLETTLPAEGLTLNSLLGIPFMIFWNSMTWLFIVGAFNTFISNPFDWGTIRNAIFLAFLLSPFLVTGLTMIYGILSSFFECKISINQQQISHSLYLWGMKIKHTSAPRENINQLVYIPQHLTKDSECGESVVKAKFVIWIGVEKLEIKVGDYIIKSEYELKWLADELSNWLGIELEITKNSS